MFDDDLIACVRRGAPLCEYTTLRVGGKADYLYEAESEEGVMRLFRAAKNAGIPVLTLGNGSNLLVRDGGFRGLVIHMGGRFSSIVRDGNTLRAQAGALLSSLARRALSENLTGLEFAGGIPGSVGGAAYMNAGAYDGEMSNVVTGIRAMDANGELIELSRDDLNYGYRHSRLMDENLTALSVTLALKPGSHDAILARMEDYSARRRVKQPLEYPSAGSFFKRPAGHFAGALIEGAGLKGLTVGGAQVSEKHAGFLINVGGATAFDFLRLMEKVQKAVYEKYGVEICPEVRIVGEEK